MRGVRLASLGLAGGILLSAAALGMAQSETDRQPPTRSSRPRRQSSSGAQTSATFLAALEPRLGQIAANDQHILARFDEIMTELQAVKIRVLRRPRNP